jgi:hypothetical protein
MMARTSVGRLQKGDRWTGRRTASGRRLAFRFFAVCWIAAQLLSCAGGSDEDEIRRMMHRIQTLVEKRDAAGLLALVTDDYEDFEGRNKDATRALVEDHFAERRGIVVHLLDTEIAPGPAEGEATAETDVVLSSGAGFLLRKAVRFAGEFYRFELNLRKTPDGWRVESARWSLSSRNELSAESLRLLQEVFPGL